MIAKLTQFTKARAPIALTIGFFDGVHLGHRALFERLKSLGHAVCVTFESHPFDVLRPAHTPPLLTPHKMRFSRIEEHVDTLLILPFSEEIASLSAEDFVHLLREHIPFSHLLLGHDGRIGKNREGTPDVLRAIGEKEGFEVTYLEPIGQDAPVSSGRIRKAVQEGDLEEAEKLLGYPYTIMGEVIDGPKAGRKVGFPTANVDPGRQVLPPFGVYAVSATCKGRTVRGVANLGVAPTLHRDRKPLLEVHLFDTSDELYGCELSCSLHTFIRSERTFDSIDALKAQIELDIQAALAATESNRGANLR